MTAHRTAPALLAVVLLAAAPAAANPIGVVMESGRLAGHTVRGSALTVGRTVRDFFEHGPHTAGRTWKANAARLKDNAHADKERVKREAQSEE
ncbi:MAG TPA: hypothetical protein VFD84_10790 [Candidatus Binatia bacterium]|nr:hypothetical protein [Candidatus Binatia bacterium]